MPIDGCTFSYNGVPVLGTSSSSSPDLHAEDVAGAVETVRGFVCRVASVSLTLNDLVCAQLGKVYHLSERTQGVGFSAEKVRADL